MPLHSPTRQLGGQCHKPATEQPHCQADVPLLACQQYAFRGTDSPATDPRYPSAGPSPAAALLSPTDPASRAIRAVGKGPMLCFSLPTTHAHQCNPNTIPMQYQLVLHCYRYERNTNTVTMQYQYERNTNSMQCNESPGRVPHGVRLSVSGAASCPRVSAARVRPCMG